MKLEEEQRRLDEEKWLKSEQEGRDVCGEFEYCKFCDKAHAHPCANALSQAAVKPAKKAPAKKACAKAEPKKACAKATAAKAPAKKAATKTATKAKK